MDRLRFGLATLLLAAAVSAQAADPVLEQHDDAPAGGWSWFGDVLARYDHLSDLPNHRPDFHRWRGRGRLGALYTAMPTLEFGAAIELAQGSDDNVDNRRNNDNERSDHAGLDQLFLRWRPGESTSVLLGKAVFPLELSPLTWDQDLRPAGVSVDHSIALNEYDRFQIVAGVFAGQHLYDDDSRIGAIQAAWRWHEGAPTRGAVLLSYLDFSHLGQLTRQGLSRTNTRVGPRLVSDYRLLDLQLVGHTQFGAMPFEARVDVVRNLGADEYDHGGRLSLVLGDRFQPQTFEFGFAWQRIQRDAVMAAFNADDWWFHSWAHGAMPWIGYGLAEHWGVRLAGFHEKLDIAPKHTDRILFDLEGRW